MLNIFGGGIENLLMTWILEGSSASPFIARRAQQLHEANPSDTHLIFKNFFYGPVECPWCNTQLGTAAV